MGRGKKLGIAVGLIFLVVIVLLAVEASLRTTVIITGGTLDFNYLNPNPRYNSIFVGWAGPTNRYWNITWTGNGGDKFNETRNVPNYDSVPQQILSVGIGQDFCCPSDLPGFSIVSVSPTPPITVIPGTYATITFTTQTPHANFKGSMTFVIFCS